MANDSTKSLEGRSVDLVTTFAGRDPAVFTVHEAAAQVGLPESRAYDLLSRLVRRGWLVRHRSGVYEVAPLWATADSPYAPDRFVALATWLPSPYYIGFRSALELHGWLRQPVFGRVWIAVPTSRHSLASSAERITWVVQRPDRFTWGLEKRWLGERSVIVSDAERTILDGLHLPRHVAGVTEIAAVLVQAWPDLDQDRLVEYLDRLGIQAVRRRLGVLLETLPLDGASALAARIHRPGSYRTPVLLDPSLPASGEVDRGWGVRLNVERAEIADAGQT